MAPPSIMNTPRARRSCRAALRGLVVVALLGGAVGCLFGGDRAEEKIDPKEAVAREANFRTAAEKARDNRFGDRLRRRVDLSRPAK